MGTKPGISPIPLIVSLLLISIFAAGCTGLRPSRQVPQETQAQAYVPPVRSDTATPVPTAGPSMPTQMADCSNSLTYLSDLTVPDGTHFNPGNSIEKKWQVKNSGTCNWVDGYTLKMVGGDPLGAAESQALIPARNGTEAVIQIDFTAPQAAGEYDSSWQAHDPQGNPFGDKIFIKITVNAP
ncbi:MAG: NBR1-Ig-like domain-containing protein [Anaerolineaceae bacterium]